jgi:ATP-dependent Clp protease ATP-binding subunit ClpA
MTMFERFTNKSRSVLVYAQDEARGLRHDFIGTEHLLLGVVAANDEAVVQALAGYDFTLEDVRTAVTAIVGPGEEEIVGAPAFTPRAKKVLELSLREALALGHDHIGVPHILLAIMREGEGVGAMVLETLGVDYDRIRLWVGQSAGESERRGRRGRRRGRNRLDVGDLGTSTRAAVRARANSASLAGNDLIGSQHLLLGLLEEPESMAAKALESLGVTKAQVEAKIAEIDLENTSDAPPRPPAKPATVALAEGVEIRISDPDLAKLAESGQLEELLKEIVRRSKPDS